MVRLVMPRAEKGFSVVALVSYVGNSWQCRFISNYEEPDSSCERFSHMERFR